MTIFETSAPKTLRWLGNVVTTALWEERKVRIQTGVAMVEGVSKSYMKIAVGGGAWTAPIWTDDDSQTAAELRLKDQMARSVVNSGVALENVFEPIPGMRIRD